MFRTHLIVLALVAAANAGFVHYSDDELDVIKKDIEECLDSVPWGDGAFNWPGISCATGATRSLGGPFGDDLTLVPVWVEECLMAFTYEYLPLVTLEMVATAKQCVNQSVAAFVDPADEPGFVHYSDAELHVIKEDIEECLDSVPRDGSFIFPGKNCAAYVTHFLGSPSGDDLTLVPGWVETCLMKYTTEYNPVVTPEIVATAKQCVKQSLAVFLEPANEPADYTSSQVKELGDRIYVCLRAYNNPLYPNEYMGVRNCRQSTLKPITHPKASQAARVTSCLEKHKFTAKHLAKAKECLEESLAKPFST